LILVIATLDCLLKIRAEAKKSHPFLTNDRVEGVRRAAEFTLGCQKGTIYNGFVQVCHLFDTYCRLNKNLIMI